ncbi:MAG TPA: DUF779 domain-containing protein [Bacillales bacterium]|nr:DUF779 domain-containing protein [Bacillales bacterium]
MKKIEASAAASELIQKLKDKHGPILFHLSGGCCDGSVPICLPIDELIIGQNDFHIDDINDCPFYMNKGQYEYWKHLKLYLDVASGRSGLFSIEGSEAVRFIIEGRVVNEK